MALSVSSDRRKVSFLFQALLDPLSKKTTEAPAMRRDVQSHHAQSAQASLRCAARLMTVPDSPKEPTAFVTSGEERDGELMQSTSTILSKWLSFVLRHKPDAIDLTLDPQGWAHIDELIAKSNAFGTRLNRAELLNVVESNQKKRFSLSDDGQRIRAAQGHSVPIELGLSPREPPKVLYHGTATHFVDSILSEGLKPQARRQVHLSTDGAIAHSVGQRHGKATVIQVDAIRMHANGFKFFRADNGVWLTDQVPPDFLALPSSATDSATTSMQPKLST